VRLRNATVREKKVWVTFCGVIQQTNRFNKLFLRTGVVDVNAEDQLVGSQIKVVRLQVSSGLFPQGRIFSR